MWQVRKPADEVRGCHLRVRLPFVGAAHPVQVRCMHISLRRLPTSQSPHHPPLQPRLPHSLSPHQQQRPAARRTLSSLLLPAQPDTASGGAPARLTLASAPASGSHSAPIQFHRKG